MATHPRILAWRIPWTEKPGGLRSVGSQRVGYDWSNWALSVYRVTPLWSAVSAKKSADSLKGVPFTDKGPYNQRYGFSSSNVQMWELDHKESWMLKNRCFWAVVLEKTLESPLDCKEIKPVNPKVNQSWIFIGRTDGEVEAPILWPPDTKNWLIRKDPDAGKDWGQEEKGTTEDEMVGWHHPLNGDKFEQAPGIGDGQGSLVCCNPWSHKKLDTTEQLNWTELYDIYCFSLVAFNILSLTFVILITMCHSIIVFCGSIQYRTICGSWTRSIVSFPRLGKFLPFIS